MSPGTIRKPVPFSRPLEAAAVGDAGLRQTITAHEAERRHLADLCGIVDIESLSSDMTIRRDGRRGLRVTGDIAARVRQTCVVTLDDFDTDVRESFDIRFQPQDEIDAQAARRARAVAAQGAEDEQDDCPDPIVNNRIDLGALVAEFLALGLDPYPKKPGTVFVEPRPVEDEGADVSPFAVLSRLKPS